MGWGFTCLAPAELFLCGAVVASTAESWRLRGRRKLFLVAFWRVTSHRFASSLISLKAREDEEVAKGALCDSEQRGGLFCIYLAARCRREEESS